MKSIYYLIIACFIFLFSCKNKIEKNKNYSTYNVYSIKEDLKNSIKDTINSFNFSLKTNNLNFEYEKPINWNYRGFQSERKKYKITKTESSILEFVDSMVVYTENITYKHKRYYIKELSNFYGCIEKTIVSNYRNIYAEGNGHTKIEKSIYFYSKKIKI